MIFNSACDIKTQEMVWVPRSIHTDEQLIFEGEIKAFRAYEISGVYHLKYQDDLRSK